MAERQLHEVRIAASAYDDIADIWTWTVQRFGTAAARRYEILIEQAIADIADDPARPGTRERPDLLQDIWLYHLEFSRMHVPNKRTVKLPRHFLIFRHPQPGVIEIIRLLHDSSDLARHLPTARELND